MKQLGKKVAALLLAVCCVLTLLPVDTYADTTETGASFEAAYTLNSATAKSGQVSTSTTVQYYKYTVTKAGYFTVGIKVTNSENAVVSSACRFSVYDDAAVPNQLETTYVTSTYTSNTYNFKTGRSVYVKIETVGQDVEANISSVIPGMSDTTVYSTTCSYNLTVTPTEASDWEQESNDTYSDAYPMDGGAWINGSTYVTSDVDWYSYTVPATGYFTCEFSALTENATWDLEIYDAQQKLLETDSGIRTLTSSKHVLPVGSKVYVKLSGVYTDARYKIRANYYATDAWEKESNNTVDTATELTAGKTIHGTVSSKSDVDFYSYTATGKGYFHFTFVNEDSGSDQYWKLSIYDADLKLIRKFNTEEDLKVTLPNLSFRAGKEVYLKVEGKTSSYGHEYSVCVEQVSESGWEQEYNDSFKKANTVKKNKTYKANSYARGDKDYFVYKAAKKGKITCKVTLPDAGEGYWKVSVYDQNKKLLASEDYVQDTQKFTVKAKKKGQKFYVVVQGRDTKAAGQTYRVTVKQK